MTDQIVGAMTPNASLIAGTKEGGTYSFSVVDEKILDYCHTQTGGEDHLTVCGQFTRDE